LNLSEELWPPDLQRKGRTPGRSWGATRGVVKHLFRIEKRHEGEGKASNGMEPEYKTNHLFFCTNSKPVQKNYQLGTANAKRAVL